MPKLWLWLRLCDLWAHDCRRYGLNALQLLTDRFAVPRCACRITKSGDEAYYVLKGTLTENTMDDAKKTSSRSQDVTLRIFPHDLAPAQAGKK